MGINIPTRKNIQHSKHATHNTPNTMTAFRAVKMTGLVLVLSQFLSSAASASEKVTTANFWSLKEGSVLKRIRSNGQTRAYGQTGDFYRVTHVNSCGGGSVSLERGHMKTGIWVPQSLH